MSLANWWDVIAETMPPNQQIRQESGAVYMERWWLKKSHPGTPDAGNVYLHRFLLDDDPEYHDHPWDSQSWLLSGKLLEKFPNGEYRWITPGMSVYRKAGDLHRVEVKEMGFSLFVTGPKIRDWGFGDGEHWVHNKNWFEREPNSSLTQVAKQVR